MKIKFSPKDHVAYKPLTSPAIEMKQTKIAGFDCTKEFNWKKQHCEIANETRNKRVVVGSVENRYVIEHYFGWYPSVQKDLNPDLDLDPKKRYYFAYESELISND
jgi:hypothetical protein